MPEQFVIEEPVFEPPPLAWAGPERRLTMQSAQAHVRQTLAHEYRDNAVTLALGADAIVATAVGMAVAASFALPPGVLGGRADGLAGVLAAACAGLGDSVVSFEAVVEAGGVCFLLRGVLLPVGGGAEAVLSWKQVLDDDATARLRAELLAARQPLRATVDAFAA